MTGKYNIHLEPTQHSRIASTNFDKLEFGSVYSDHMFVADYKNGNWQDLKIIPFQNISMSPATSVLHYGQSIFEGLKAYKKDAHEILVFRPEAHAKRFNKSAERLSMPAFPEDLFIQALTELIKMDKDWIPPRPENSLYIRPFMYASDEYIGVRPSQTYKCIIFSGPVAGYYSGTVKVLVETHYVRAAEGGIGFAKSGGNYAASLLPAKLAQEKGYQQLLWTDSKDHKYFEESGTMNLMFQLGDKIVTPPLGSSILAGITRDSIITLARDWGIKVEERKVSIDEVIHALGTGLLKDAFGTGTAATITHIDTIHYAGQDYSLPPTSERMLSNRLSQALTDLKFGKLEDKYHWLYNIPV